MVFFWFRRDLRWRDNHGLYRALKAGQSVQPVFIFDSNILRLLRQKDARVEFILENLRFLQAKFAEYGSSLLVLHGEPEKVWARLIEDHQPSAVYANHDYEPYAISRDERVAALLKKNGVEFYSYKDQVIFEKNEVITNTGQVYKVYTPYAKKWKLQYTTLKPRSYPSSKYLQGLHKSKSQLPTLEDLGFTVSGLQAPGRQLSFSKLKSYAKKRDFPAEDATTRMGVHLRFGTLSPRLAVKYALKYSDIWLNELIWREFFMNLLFHFPHTAEHAFKAEYEAIKWRNDAEEFELWKAGQTGFPLVDAGMRELAETGFMHNRVRMVVASFLSKHLLIDWRWGERWFAEKLLDFDLASNVGNWQWAAGCGADAAPYFRVFNPEMQLKKFDPQFEYVKRWVPEWQTKQYPSPVVDHKMARDRALRVYAEGIKGR